MVLSSVTFESKQITHTHKTTCFFEKLILDSLRKCSKIHNFLIFHPNFMILFLFDRYLSLDYYALERKFFKYQFLRKCAFFASRLRTFRSVLRLRVNDIGKICLSSMLCRMTRRTTFVVGSTSESLPLGLQNFLKFDDQIQHNAFLMNIFKNSYLPVY